MAFGGFDTPTKKLSVIRTHSKLRCYTRTTGNFQKKKGHNDMHLAMWLV